MTSHDESELSGDDAIDVLLKDFLGLSTWTQYAQGMRSLRRDMMLDALISLRIFADGKKDHHAARAIDRYIKFHCEKYGITREYVEGLGFVRSYQEEDNSRPSNG